MRFKFYHQFLFLSFFTAHFLSAKAQNKESYVETFTNGASYCPGDRQYDNWIDFRKNLDTAKYQFTKLTFTSNQANSARTCSDVHKVRQIAQALKDASSANISITVTCNGFDFSVAKNCQSTNCGNSTNDVMLEADASNAGCSCNNNFIIRPGIGNANWGGVGTTSCGPPTQKVEVHFEKVSTNYDAAVLSINEIDKCSNTDDIEVRVANYGKKTLNTFDLTYQLNNGTPVTKSCTTTLAPLTDTLITVASNVKFVSGTNYTLQAWTSSPNGFVDSVSANDSSSIAWRTLGTPSPPSINDTAVCGGQEVLLVAKPTNPSLDSLLWSDTSSMTNLLGVGSSFLTPFLKSGKHKYFVSATRNFQAGSASTPFTANNGQEGFFVDITSSRDITIDSFATNIDVGAQETVELYIKDGSYNGAQTNRSAWTQVGTQTVTPAGLNRRTVVNIPFKLKAGKSYGLCVRLSTGTQINYRTLQGAGDVITSGPFTITRGQGSYNNFGGVFSPRGGDLELYYAIAECPSPADSSEITINKLASGASIDSASTFEGFLYAGNANNPDIAAENKELNYELLPPTGFNNADHGSTWEVVDVSLTSANGTPVDTSSYAFTNPSSSGNGNLKYTTDMGWADSTVEINWIIRELKNNCDTLVKRTLFIAPTTKLVFSSNDVCLGDFIQFKNNSTISSGYSTFFWDFGDGNTSDIISPIHIYEKFGKYNVKLTAVSDLGIEIDTSFSIEVFEIPNIDFKIFNACEGAPINIQNNTTISSGTIKWNWKFGDGDSSALKSPSHQYSKFGAYKITLFAEANGCVSEESKTAFQFAKPTANFTSTGICANSPINFESSSTIGDNSYVGHSWTFENNEFGTLSKEDYTFTSNGDKDVKLITTTKFGCKDSITKTISVAASPLADFSVGQACDIDPTSITNLSNENGLSVTYLWSFGDGNTSTDKDPQSYQYSDLGNKTIKLQAFAKNGCSSSKSMDIFVGTQPTAGFEVGNACSGEQVNFINTTKSQGGKVSYAWDFGDGNASNDLAATHIYNVSSKSSYTVSLVASINQGCRDTFSKTIEVGEIPNCGFTAAKDKTDRRIWTFTPSNGDYGADAYQWQFGGTGYSNDVSPTHSFPFENNEYRVILFITTELGCKCMDTTQTVYTDWSIGIDQLDKENGFVLYPNPAKDLVSIQLQTSATANYKASITDISGKVIFSKELLFREGHATLKLENINAGNYLLKLEGEDGSLSQKLTIK